jgi:seryl-tRNA synthetase
MMLPTEFSNESLYNELVAHRHIIPMGVPGLFARGQDFEKVIQKFEDVLSRVAAGDPLERMTFPPAIPRKLLEEVEYLDNMPQLSGSVFSFTGNDAKARELSAKVHAGDAWGDMLTQTEVCLTPAACYPVYPSCSGVLPEAGRNIELQNWVFRHEPSLEPTRAQFFRMREFIRLGSPQMVVDYRNLWLQRALDLLTNIGLPVVSDVANDPFFGRVGKMMAASQRDLKLKFEIVVPVISVEKPTAICSFNYHKDHFGQLFGIKMASGDVAQTACVGFGLERIAMALFKYHGMAISNWPKNVREVLGL